MITEPDGFLGAVLAAEGCGANALINGPGGCRSRAINLWRELSAEYVSENPQCCRSRYYSRQSHLPCTYLNSEDMVLGSGNKIADSLRSVSSISDKDTVLIDALGASLQVTDRNKAVIDSGTENSTVLSDEDLAHLSFSEAFDRTVASLTEHAGLETGGKENTVSILGYSYADSSWNFGKKNLSYLLGLMDLEVVCYSGCRTTKAEISRSGTSEAVILIHPEMSEETSEVYRKNGCRTVVPSFGSPIGFDAIRSFVNEVADATGTSPDMALKTIDCEEEKMRRILRNCDKESRSFRGYCSAFKGLPSDICPLMEWMYDYFGLLPSSVEPVFCRDSVYSDRIRGFLKNTGSPDAYGRPVRDSGLKTLFTDGFAAEDYKARHPAVSCIGITMPFARKGEFVDRSLVGLGGCRYILDSVINGLGEFKCGQPTMADFR